MSIEKLELKHVTLYLPYNVYCQYNGDNELFETKLTTENIKLLIDSNNFKLILHKLEDLQLCEYSEELKKYARTYFNFRYHSCCRLIDDFAYGFKENQYSVMNEDVPLFMYNWLVEHHFDVNLLINAGYAVDYYNKKN